MDAQEELTLQAASRLIKSRLRLFVYSRMAEKTMWQDEAISFENVISGLAEEGWKSALQMWDLSKPEVRQSLIVQIRRALQEAVSDTEALLVDANEAGDARESNPETIRPLIEAYRQGFQPEELLS